MNDEKLPPNICPTCGKDLGWTYWAQNGVEVQNRCCACDWKYYPCSMIVAHALALMVIFGVAYGLVTLFLAR